MTRILIVDDMVDNSRPLARMLRHAGFDAHFVESGPDALSFVEKSPPDLVLLDVMMPEMNGLEVLARLRTTPKTAKLPVVMFTACDNLATRAACHARGATDYWVKDGVDFTVLRGRIERALGNSALGNSARGNDATMH